MGVPTSPALCLGAIVASNLPDLDLFGPLFGLPIRRTHRQASHSLLVLVGLVLFAAWIWSWLSGDLQPGLWLAWSVALFSHPILDVITTDSATATRGFGIPLFWPFTSQRWYVRRPIYRPVGLKAYVTLNEGVWKGLLVEICLLAPLSIAAALLGHLL
jgi:membrane-bound metal-dependent hydrolase YbcI (DUF457 family)